MMSLCFYYNCQWLKTRQIYWSIFCFVTFENVALFGDISTQHFKTHVISVGCLYCYQTLRRGLRSDTARAVWAWWLIHTYCTYTHDAPTHLRTHPMICQKHKYLRFCYLACYVPCTSISHFKLYLLYSLSALMVKTLLLCVLWLIHWTDLLLYDDIGLMPKLNEECTCQIMTVFPANTMLCIGAFFVTYIGKNWRLLHSWIFG